MNFQPHLQMGNCVQSSDTAYDTSTGLSIQQFQQKQAIGIGTLGRVVKVLDKRQNKIYAMKQMLKSRVIYNRSVRSVLFQRSLLSKLNHPFIVNMKYAFQDTTSLYLLMEYMSGGDLRFHLCQKKKFSQNTARFFIACTVLGLEYLHSHRIIHKDIKPENLVFDQRGYLKITDFGIATVCKPDNDEQTQGTPGYMAPQVLFKAKHSYQSDFFALGVILHQLLTGQRPYLGKNKTEFKESVLKKQVKITYQDIGQVWSEESADFFNKLIQRKPQRRLGKKGIEEVKGHQWLSGIDWDGLASGTLISPFVPTRRDNFCPAYIRKGWNDKANLKRIVMNDTAHLFQGYFFDYRVHGIGGSDKNFNQQILS